MVLVAAGAGLHRASTGSSTGARASGRTASGRGSSSRRRSCSCGFGLVWPAIRTDLPEPPRRVATARRASRSTTTRTSSRTTAYFNFNDWADIFTSRLFFLAAGAPVRGDRLHRASAPRQRNPDAGVDLSSARSPSIAVVAASILLLLAVFSTLRGTIWNNLWWVVSGGRPLDAARADAGGPGRPVARRERRQVPDLHADGAISFVGAAIIWRYVYYRNTPREDIGLLNDVLAGRRHRLDEPIDFYTSATHHPLEQLLHHDHHDLDPDRLRDGDPVGGDQGACRRRRSRRRRSTAPPSCSRSGGWSSRRCGTTMVVVRHDAHRDGDEGVRPREGDHERPQPAPTCSRTRCTRTCATANFTASATFAMIIVLLVLPIVYINVRRHRETRLG